MNTLSNNQLKEEDMPDQEMICFNQLQRKLKLSDIYLLQNYLEELFNHLSARCSKFNSLNNNSSSSSKFPNIDVETFSGYMRIPLLISEKIFKTFKTNKEEINLTAKEFIDGMTLLFTGEYSSTLKLVFDIYDFNKKGVILKHDVRLLLSFIPINQNENMINRYNYQKESQEELDKILKSTFSKSNTLNFDEFKNVVECSHSDIFLFLIGFIYHSCPINYLSLDIFKLASVDDGQRSHKRKHSCLEFNKITNNQLTKLPNSLYSPMKRPGKLKNYLASSSVFEDSCDLSIISKSPNRGSEENLKLEDEEITHNMKKVDLDVGELKKYLPKISPLSNLNSKINANNELNQVIKKPNLTKSYKDDKSINEKKDVKFKTVKINDSQLSGLNEKNKSLLKSDSSKGGKRNTLEESSLYDSNKIKKITSTYKINSGPEYEVFIADNYCTPNSLKLKKVFLKVVDHDLFFFRDTLKDQLLFLINLSSYYISEIEVKHINKLLYQTITLHLINKEHKSDTEIFNKESKENTPKKQNFIDKYSIFITGKDNAESLRKVFINIVKQKKVSEEYEIKDLLGEGAFGQVKLALNKTTKEKVAIKILNKEKLSKDQLIMARNEIDIMTLCCHPNIVNLYEVIEDNSAIYIIMEYLKGDDLFSYLDLKVKLTEKYIKHLMHPVVEAVRYIHSFGIVHRDMKLDNIMIYIDKLSSNEEDFNKIVPKIRQKIERESKKNMPNITAYAFEEKDFLKASVKLTDFGISKVIGLDEYLNEPIGTLRFSAPEILNGKPYNRQVDVWALGVCFFLLFCGEYPFEDKCKETTTQRILYEELKFKEDIWKSASPGFIDLIKGCLTKDPLKRFTINKVQKHDFFTK